MHKCNCSPPDGRYPAHLQVAIAATQATPPSLCTEHDVVWNKTPLWPLWVSCPSCVPSQLSVHLAGQATTENISMLSTLFSSQIQNTILHQLPERKLALSQPKPGQQANPHSGNWWDPAIWHFVACRHQSALSYPKL